VWITFACVVRPPVVKLAEPVKSASAAPSRVFTRNLSCMIFARVRGWKATLSESCLTAVAFASAPPSFLVVAS
jgi:hypothetical protein